MIPRESVCPNSSSRNVENGWTGGMVTSELTQGERQCLGSVQWGAGKVLCCLWDKVVG